MTEKEKVIVELAIVGANYCITQLQSRIAKAERFLQETAIGLPTRTKKSPLELRAVILQKQKQIKELEDLKFELECQTVEDE